MKKVLNYYKPEHDFFCEEKCPCLAEASGTVNLTLTLYTLIHWKSNRVRGRPFVLSPLGSQPVSLQMIGSCVTRPPPLLSLPPIGRLLSSSFHPIGQVGRAMSSYWLNIVVLARG